MHVCIARTQHSFLFGLYTSLLALAALTLVFSPITSLGFIVIGALFTLITRPKWSLYAAVLLFPLIHFKPIAGLKPAEVCLLAIFISALLLVISRKRQIRLIKPVTFLVLFIGICISSFINSIGTPKDVVIYEGWIYSPNVISFNWIMRFLVIALILLLVPWVVNEERTFRRVTHLHMFTGTMASIFSFLLIGLFIFRIPLDIPICRSFGGYAGMWGLRLAGTAYEPAGFANYLLSVIPVTMAMWLDERHYRRELLLLTAFIIQSFAMLFTLSSGGWIATILALSLLLYRLRGKLNRRKRAGLLALVLVPVFILIIVISSGLFTLDKASFVLIGKFTTNTTGKTDRISTGNILLKMIKDHPILGIGPGNFAYLLKSYTHSPSVSHNLNYRDAYPATWKANNDYLTIAAETGIPGITVFLLFIASLLLFLLKAAKQATDGPDEATITGVFCAVIALLIQAFASFTIFNPFAWVLSAVVYGYYRTAVCGTRSLPEQA